ncbi:MAG: hypothetical protein AAGI71_12500 [Bacteroidota bacterium]
MSWRSAVLLVTVLCAAPAAAAQEASIPLSAYRDTLDLDLPQPFVLRPFVLPGTVQVFIDGQRVDPERYRVDLRHGRITFRPRPRANTLVVVAYQTWQPALETVYRRRRLAAADSVGIRQVVVPNAEPTATDVRSLSRLQRSGSITRGVVAGNNQDVTVESGLRLNLSGEIADGVTVQGVLTDANTPIQPEGTTQRLDELDRVYLELQAPVGTARLGDLDVAYNQGVFSAFTRQLQGVSVSAPLPLLDGSSQISFAGAVSRGQYRTQEIIPIEGVQGPYRLEGPQGEPFILVLAGTESVFFDGERLERGETRDYVIDYGTGELSFTSNRLITAERRITVEYQFTTNQFTRSLLGGEAEVGVWPGRNGTPRLVLGTTVLREADSPAFNEELGLSAADSLLLVGAGDTRPARSGAEVVPFDPEAPFVPYRAEELVTAEGDTLIIYRVLDVAPAPGTPVFRVRFTRVGVGQGSYRRDRPGQQINGVAYTYVGPGGGEYDPIRPIPAPFRRSLFDLRGRIRPLAGLEVYGEWARSSLDLNRLSDLGDADNQGSAGLAGLRLVERSLGPVRLSVEAERRLTSSRFAAFNRTRPIEYARRWNLAERGLDADGTEPLGTREVTDVGRLLLATGTGSRLTLEAGRLDRSLRFEGRRLEAGLSLAEPGRPQLDYQLEAIESTDREAALEGRWFRQRGQLRVPLLQGRLEPGVSMQQERRRQRLTGPDSLTQTSLAFLEVQPRLAWITDALTASAEVALRDEEEPLDGRLMPSSRAWTSQATVQWQPSSTWQTDARVGYRVRRFRQAFQEALQRQDQESLVLRWAGSAEPAGRAVRISWLYDALTERTPTLQEVYYRAGPEFGEYVWEDDGDGIPEVDEFVRERLPNEGTYLLTYLPSDSLTGVISVQARLSVGLDPARAWREASTRWQRALAQVQTQTTLDLLEKSETPTLSDVYLLRLGTFRNATFTQQGRLRLRQTVTLFSGDPRVGVTAAYARLDALQRLASGREEQGTERWEVQGTYRPGLRWTFQLTGRTSREAVTSEAFATRQYDITSRSVEPAVTATASQALQGTVRLALTRKDDAQRSLSARLVRLPVQVRYARARRYSVTAQGEVADVRLDAAPEDLRGQASFALTEGRGPGTSFLWTLSGQATLTQYLRATVQYEGRAPAEAPTIHTLRVQLSAVF